MYVTLPMSDPLIFLVYILSYFVYVHCVCYDCGSKNTSILTEEPAKCDWCRTITRKLVSRLHVATRSCQVRPSLGLLFKNIYRKLIEKFPHSSLFRNGSFLPERQIYLFIPWILWPTQGETERRLYRNQSMMSQRQDPARGNNNNMLTFFHYLSLFLIHDDITYLPSPVMTKSIFKKRKVL